MGTLHVTRGPGLDRFESAGRAVGGWVTRFAHWGYAAKGVVYAIIGVLAVKLAAGQGGRTTDGEGAVATLARQPFGTVLLALLTVGLALFVAWRLVQALLDPERRGTSGKGLLTRALYLVSAAVYGALALSAARMVAGASARGGRGPKEWTATLLEQPFGQVLVGLVGVGVLAYAVGQFQSAWTAKFRRKLSLGALSPEHQRWAIQVSRFGIAARGVVFLLSGGFLLAAAVHADPGEARGLGESLAVLARQPSGPGLLGVVALGLVAYAAYLFIESRYRRIGAP